MSSTLERLSAALANRYRIERELGQGGMATVYLAHDLKHDRDVAIKVLHADLGAALGSDRFLSEIRTTARLQHPHILPLLDSGEAEGLLYYVMPLVVGETLRTRLERERQLPIAEAVRIAREVASALDYAHRQGVIHRDIKPENILLHDGQALVADFGIALAVQTAGGARMTQTGLSLGTPQYMSPEQAMGERVIDARSDIYALGAVTYEMLAGDPPFTGSSVQAIVARILTEKPTPIHTLRDTVPEPIETAVLTALAKLPADRPATAAEFGAALSGTETTGRRSTVVSAGRPAITPRQVIWPVAAALLLAAALWGWLRPQPEPMTSRQQVVLWRQVTQPFLSPGIQREETQATIAPDGSSIVFTDSEGGAIQLRRKRRFESEIVTLAGTEGGVSPFFSPDGSWIGFVTIDGKLRKVPATGGGAVTLAEGLDPTYSSAAWQDDGTIIYVTDGQLMGRVPAEGGPGKPIGSASFWRQFNVGTVSPLPGSRGFLYTWCPGNCALGSNIQVYDFAADSGRLLVPNAAGAWYSPTGHLLYTSRSGGLYAAGFDPIRLELTSGTVPVIPDVLPTAFAISPSGSILYSVAKSVATPAELVWVSRDGSETPVDPEWRGDFGYPAVSPDGGTIAVSVSEATTHLWIRRADGTRQKLTERGTVNWRPAWTPDGRSVVFTSNLRGEVNQADFDLYRMPVDGSAPAELLQDHRFGLWEGELSRDGAWVVVRADEDSEKSAIRLRRLSGDTALLPLVVGREATQLALSPDGQWLAYTNEVYGRYEVYVMPFPGGGWTRPLSRGDGSEPRWARSGRELFFKSGDRLMAVDVAPGSTFGAGNPRPLFSVAKYRSAKNRPQYDVTPDGRRFLMIRDVTNDTPAQTIYVENWFAELRAKVKP